MSYTVLLKESFDTVNLHLDMVLLHEEELHERK